jgi:hypothetical protein
MILFEPLNPEFPKWEVSAGDRFEVIAEFLRVLD